MHLGTFKLDARKNSLTLMTVKGRRTAVMEQFTCAHLKEVQEKSLTHTGYERSIMVTENS